MALSMTANGANNETLSQIEQVLGAEIEGLNKNLLNHAKILKNNDLHIANSIWINERDDTDIVKKFFEMNLEYYQAEINKEKFNNKTAGKINGWVDKHTEGMIKEIINDVHPDSVMYLVNAIAFDAKWEETYAEHQVHNDLFTNHKKDKKEIKLMQSEENIYLSDGQSIGFIKPYAENKFSFVGILPDNIHQYVSEMTGETFLNLINSSRRVKVDAYLPKFTYDYGVKMNDLLISLGMVDAFDQVKADFSKMAKTKGENIYIDEVLHKTFIEVDELGTKAAAVTSVGMVATTATINEERYQVKLNKPFIYIIMDNETNWPIFMGTVLDIDK
ncbi:MAG TPA: serine protease [Clostridia bacterium]|jgi:serine protease inhibitor|nr:serine protease [Clostridia bacterium]